jgi:hypothetical protein
MSYEVTFVIRDSGVKNGAVLTTQPAPPTQAIKTCLKHLTALGYPMRNTVTELIRELLFIKFELDFKGKDDGTTELRGDTRGSPARVGAGKAPNARSAL